MTTRPAHEEGEARTFEMTVIRMKGEMIKNDAPRSETVKDEKTGLTGNLKEI